jgi:hypothetical protein
MDRDLGLSREKPPRFGAGCSRIGPVGHRFRGTGSFPTPAVAVCDAPRRHIADAIKTRHFSTSLVGLTKVDRDLRHFGSGRLHEE